MTAPTTATAIVTMLMPVVKSLPPVMMPGEEPADQAADDSEHDVADHAEALVALDEVSGDIAGDRSYDKPRDDAHWCTSSNAYADRCVRASFSP